MPLPEAPPTAAPAPTFDRVEARLSGPSSLRFVADRPQGAAELSAGEVLGYFDADAANGLAGYPDDFQLLGGRDSEYFETVYNGRANRTGLAATKALADAASAGKLASSRAFIVRVVARDRSGNRSAPADLTFTLQPQAQARPDSAAETEAAVTDLSGEGMLPRVARAVAQRVAARGTPDYFDAYKYALAEPTRCGAGQDAGFVDHYRSSFIRFRDRISKDNVDSFYTGLCEAWEEALRASRESAAAADADRQRVIAANASAKMQAQVRAAGARLTRNAALAFAFSALLAFMMIALFLAFMAIEGHSAAVRQAIEMLAARKGDRDESHELG